MNIVSDDPVGMNINGSKREGGSDDGGDREGPISEASSVFYQVTPYRWGVLACVFAVNLINAAFWLTYSPIADKVADKYDVSKNVVNILSYCMSGLYGPVVWGAAPVVKKIGFGNSVRVAAGLTMAGGVVRYFGQSHSTFFFLVIGQCLSGIARPLVSQLLGLVSLQWFPAHQRVLATAIAALGNPFGIGLGFALSPAIVGDNPDRVVRLNLVCMILGLVMFILTMLVVKDRPANDPSEAAIQARENKDAVPFWEEMKHLKNSQYWLMCVAFGLGFGQTNAVAIMLNTLLKPFGYNNSTIGLTGVMTILPGIIGAGVVAGYLGKRPLHREALIVIYLIGGVLLQAMMLIACRENTVEKYGQANPFILISAALFGFFAQPCFSVAIELGSETVYPASPSMASAGVVMCAQYVGLIVSVIFSAYITAVGDLSASSQSGYDHQERQEQDRVHVAGYVMSGCWIIAGVLMIFFRKDNMARLSFEKEQKLLKKQEKAESKKRARLAEYQNRPKFAESHEIPSEDHGSEDETTGLIQKK
eukprot:TRINITY_DN1175_c1_g2_i1.p1 TRINITY_DN1175_c1_g2~~TRINITY_DN1175_c1_g2_i1.p1  ORF type:complete len:545 (+),score=169.66 TRINITY_DN1175_c1_g2_i1:37-1635(+)